MVLKRLHLRSRCRDSRAKMVWRERGGCVAPVSTLSCGYQRGTIGGREKFPLFSSSVRRRDVSSTSFTGASNTIARAGRSPINAHSLDLFWRYPVDSGSGWTPALILRFRSVPMPGYTHQIDPGLVRPTEESAHCLDRPHISCPAVVCPRPVGQLIASSTCGQPAEQMRDVRQGATRSQHTNGSAFTGGA